jgi:hypothetical protein
LLADVSFAIIGIDFLKHFKLVVDAAVAVGPLIDTHTMEVIPAASGGDKRLVAASRGGLFCAVGTDPPAYRGLLVDFQDVLHPRGDLPPLPPPGYRLRRPATAPLTGSYSPSSVEYAFSATCWKGVGSLCLQAAHLCSS